MDSKQIELIRLFREVGKIAQRIVRKQFESKGITMPQSMVIGMLHKNGKMKITDISNEMNLTNSTVSGLIDRLELRATAWYVSTIPKNFGLNPGGVNSLRVRGTRQSHMQEE